MRKKLLGSIVACAAVGLTFFGFAACSKTPVDPEVGDDGGDGKLAAVDASTISVREEIFFNGNLGTIFSWGAVENAEAYIFTCNGVEVTLTRPSITLQNYSQITLPSDGYFSGTIVATAMDYSDSQPVSYSYTVRGCELNGISVTSFDGGIIKWQADPLAKGYTVTVNDGAGIPVTQPEFNLNESQYSGALKIKIQSSGDGVYTKTGSPFMVGVNAAHTKLHLLPIADFTVADGVISWGAIPGVSKYRIVDIERNTKVITERSYDYSESVPLYGVYPISDNNVIADAEIAPINIPYLSGQGTHSSPYQIKNPIDFRAIDYYEAVYAEKIKTSTVDKNYYIVVNSIDFNSVNVLEEESNFYALSQPFYGSLNGNFKELANIRIRHRSGYWAMFDYITRTGEVTNLSFTSPDIQNSMIQPTLPINASIATVAYKNYGTVSGITVTGANYQAAGGEVTGICWNNYGTVSGCTLGGEFTQKATGQNSQACYEMAGIVGENYGAVTGNKITTLKISGTPIPIKDDKGNPTGNYYNNVRCAAGIVAVNRAGGLVSNNSYESLTMATVLDATENEFGGLVAYNAPSATVSKGSGSLGTFIHNGATVSNEDGVAGNLRGKVVGKNQGTRS